MLLTIKEVALSLQIKPATLYAWASQGRIPCIKIHGLVRFQKEEIDQWVEGFRERPKAAESPRVQPKAFDIDRVIARAKRAAYNARHGETRLRSSPIGKEAADGAV
ncbi:MAG: helix-turn-helix domain-containing protein [Nitrospira sp.]|jgi:excisionase family DNA binding protein